MKCAILLVALFSCSLASPIYNTSSVDELTDDEYLEEFFRQGQIPMPDGRIIGGTNARIEDLPYQCSLRLRNSHVCGCSIISASRGLTAAHCYNQRAGPTAYTVQAGSTTRLGDSGAVRRSVTRFTIHQQYNSRTVNNDIAVLWFAQDFPLSARIRPVALPARNSPVPFGATCIVSGWGTTREGVSSSISDILQVVSKPIVSNQQCNVPYQGRILNTMFCAGVPEGGRDACQGDSGGPLVVNGVQYGVVSWGRGCGRPNIPGVYARVPVFVDWIAQNI